MLVRRFGVEEISLGEQSLIFLFSTDFFLVIEVEDKRRWKNTLYSLNNPFILYITLHVSPPDSKILCQSRSYVIRSASWKSVSAFSQRCSSGSKATSWTCKNSMFRAFRVPKRRKIAVSGCVPIRGARRV
jgi:hypothetical protein